MNDITALTPEKLAEIRQRHTPVAAPKCHICGAEMTIGAMSASRIVYACSGATYDDAGCHYAPGRSIADDHYAQSRVTVVDVSDPDVLTLVEALEKAQAQSSKWLEAYHKAVSVGARYEERIAELESRTVTVKLPAVEKWRKPDAVRAQNAYRILTANELAAAGIQIIEGEGQ